MVDGGGGPDGRGTEGGAIVMEDAIPGGGPGGNGTEGGAILLVEGVAPLLSSTLSKSYK